MSVKALRQRLAELEKREAQRKTADAIEKRSIAEATKASRMHRDGKGERTHWEKSKASHKVARVPKARAAVVYAAPGTAERPKLLKWGY